MSGQFFECPKCGAERVTALHVTSKACFAAAEQRRLLAEGYLPACGVWRYRVRACDALSFEAETLYNKRSRTLIQQTWAPAWVVDLARRTAFPRQLSVAG